LGLPSVESYQALARHVSYISIILPKLASNIKRLEVALKTILPLLHRTYSVLLPLFTCFDEAKLFNLSVSNLLEATKSILISLDSITESIYDSVLEIVATKREVLTSSQHSMFRDCI